MRVLLVDCDPKLQRGLGSKAEEGARPTREGRRTMRFNGASARRPRKGGLEKMARAIVPFLLQRGLGSKAEEGLG